MLEKKSYSVAPKIPMSWHGNCPLSGMKTIKANSYKYEGKQVCVYQLLNGENKAIADATFEDGKVIAFNCAASHSAEALQWLISEKGMEALLLTSF